MFLLIPTTTPYSSRNAFIFTFQYVSINTCSSQGLLITKPTLHSSMFLLILDCCHTRIHSSWSLHSSMFLLILCPYSFLSKKIYPLHSSMFLLILVTFFNLSSQLHTLHSSMFLLIHRISGISKYSITLYIPVCFY